MKKSLLALVCAVLMAPGYSHALIDINTADLATLDTLPGIGATLAQRIIDYRSGSPFTNISQIKNVSGIGDSIYNNIKDLITVSAPSSSDQDLENAGNSQTASTTSASSTASTTTSTVSQKAMVSSYVAPPVPQIFADGGDDRTVLVAADIEFQGRAYNRNQEFVDNVRFVWNFGDGSTAEGNSVRHHFRYPGRYFVSLSVAHDRSAASDYMIITAEPASLAFDTNSDGSISIANLSARELDLSFWHIRSFQNTFSLPEGTRVLEGETLRISQQTLKFFSTAASAELLYPNGEVALRAGERSQTAVPETTTLLVPAIPEISIDERSVSSVREVSQSQIETEGTSAEQMPGLGENVTDIESERLVASAATSAPKSYWWIGVIALAIVTGGGVVVLNRMRKKEWDIIGE